MKNIRGGGGLNGVRVSRPKSGEGSPKGYPHSVRSSTAEALGAPAGFSRVVIASQSGTDEAIGIRFWFQDARPLVSRHELDGDRSQPGQAVLGIHAPMGRANQPQRTPLRAQHIANHASSFYETRICKHGQSFRPHGGKLDETRNHRVHQDSRRCQDTRGRNYPNIEPLSGQQAHHACGQPCATGLNCLGDHFGNKRRSGIASMMIRMPRTGIKANRQPGRSQGTYTN